MKRRYDILFVGILLTLLFSCSNTKHLGPGENLYVGAKIKIETTDKLSPGKRRDLREELEDLARPKPNSKILGARLKLAVYNMVDSSKAKKGINRWLKYTIGEPPVIASMKDLQKNAEIFQNRLENHGYFHDTVTLDTSIKSKKLTAIYTAHVTTQYTIHKVTFPQGDDSLSVTIRSHVKRTLLKPKQPFDLDVIKDERSRIDARLKERGFFYFSPDYLVINVDSTIGNHQVDMNMLIKPQTPLDASRSYRINDIVVYADYHVNDDSTIRADTSFSRAYISTDGYKIIDPKNKFNKKLFDRLLIFKKDSTYNRTSHNLSLNRLVTLGVFRFVKARFEKTDTATGDYLNGFYYLTPAQRQSIRFTATALTKSNNATGGQLSINWLHRNLFRGAEQFTVGPYIGLEKQISSQRNASTERAGIDVQLSVPRIISPFHFKLKSGYAPKTKFEISYELFRSDTLYTLNSFTASYGYVWKQKLENEKTFNLVNISYVRPSNIQPAFQREIDTVITLYRTIEPQLIFGPSFNYNYNSQARPNNKPNNYYVNLNAEESGSLVGLLTHANVNKGKQVDIFNVPFSEYIRFESDLRYYHNITKYTVFAARFWGGIGYAYGNSQFMPFAKAFFAGGTNDIRAFRSRALGPGSYFTPPKYSNLFLPEQPADIKLESSVELREKLFSIVRGAIFVDAGNVWTLRKDTARPGAQFTGNFLSQIAVGAGFGLRFDLTILVLRLDLAYPIKKPYASYLSSNKPVYNLAIGYPF